MIECIIWICVMGYRDCAIARFKEKGSHIMPIEAVALFFDDFV